MAGKTPTLKEVKDHIKASLSGQILLSRHVQEQMKTRAFDIHDVRNVMIHGTINSISPDLERDNLKVEMEGLDFEGEGLALVLAIDPPEPGVVVVTGFAPRRRE